MPIRATPRLSSSPRVRSITLHRPTVLRQFGNSGSPMLTAFPAARISARATIVATELTCPVADRHELDAGLALTLTAAGDGRQRMRHLAQRLSPERQQVDRVLGLDVNLITAGVAEHASHRRRDHPVAVRIAEDHHPAADTRVADEVAGVGPPHAQGGSLPAVIANFSGGYTNHGLPGSNVSTGRGLGTYPNLAPAQSLQKSEAGLPDSHRQNRATP